jgi:predicted MFS family arabinose efflux permease
MPVAVVALGITQIISWGTTLYALGVLAAPIALETGWSRSLVFAGLTVGLLGSGMTSAPIGRWTDRIGARKVMSLGSVLVAAGLVMLSQAYDVMTYLLAWAVLGPAMRMTLYDAAFTGLVQVTPSRGRRAISYLTLFGGFASSVFWPIGHILSAELTWRGTCLIYAALNLLVCLPLHWWGLARQESTAADPTQPSQIATEAGATTLDEHSRKVALLLFAIATSATAFVFGAMAVHLPPLLEAHGLAAGVAVTLASIKGVAQVGGRVCEIVWGKRLHALDLGRISIGFMPIAFAVLMAGGASFSAAFAFTILFGIGNGLVTIVRGAVPLALFGKAGYGAILGLLATPYLILNALAPAILAVVIDLGGYAAAEALLLGVGLIAALAMEVMAVWYRRLSRR